MAFHFYHATKLESLFPRLHELLMAERRRLQPQTPQSVIVGNLDTESWLQQKIIAQESILMGIEFPFLETAIDAFSLRLSERRYPDAHESWFSVPNEKLTKRKLAGIAHIEIVLLGLLQESSGTLLAGLPGLGQKILSPIEQISVAHNIALKLREYLLHVPALMEEFANAIPRPKDRAIAGLWRQIKGILEKAQYSSNLIFPERLSKIIASTDLNRVTESRNLYLVGMPLLSAYHIQALTQISKVLDVHLMSVLPTDASTSDTCKKAITAYMEFLHSATKRTGTKYSEFAIASPRTNQAVPKIWRLPGTWRGAELLADHWHALLDESANIRQTDLAIIATNPEKQFAAFDRACGMRELTLSTRTQVFQRAHPFVELLDIIASGAESGVDRVLLLQFWNNAAVREAYHIGAAEISTAVEILDRTHGFRGDYPKSQQAFNLDAALQRVLRGLCIDPTSSENTDFPAAHPVRSLESPAAMRMFISMMTALPRIVDRLQQLKGRKLLVELEQTLAGTQLDQVPAYAGFSLVLEMATELSEHHEISLQQFTRFAAQYVPASTMLIGNNREGITFSPLQATCLVRPYSVIFDLNEDMEREENVKDQLVPEYDAAPTRLSNSEQSAIALESALASDTTELILAYTHMDETTGAEKYLSRQIEALRANLAPSGNTLHEYQDFEPTLFSSREAGTPMVSAEADAITIAYIHNNATPAPTFLRDTLVPPPRGNTTDRGLSVADLESFIINPTRYMLQRRSALSPITLDFRRDAPRLAVSSAARYQFCENYLMDALRDARGTAPQNPADYIEERKRQGNLPPDGFDHAIPLLDSYENAERVKGFATAECSQTRLIEYIFSNQVTHAFATQDGERLERRYLPAPIIGGVAISGTLRQLVSRHGAHALQMIDSAVYPHQAKAMVRAYLFLSLMQLSNADAEFITAGIEVSNYKFAGKKAQPDKLDPRLTAAGTILTERIKDAQQYLEQVVAGISSYKPFWFDLDLFPGARPIGKLAETDSTEIIAILNAPQRETQAGKGPPLNRFYDINADASSYEHFAKFIEPVVKLDAENQTSKSKAGKRG
jgi:exonuclease V gamma subunit